MNASSARNSRSREKESGPKKSSSNNKMKAEPTSKFIKVRCPKCKNEQIIFEKASEKIECLVCQNVLAEPTGGKAKILAQVLETLQ